VNVERRLRLPVMTSDPTTAAYHRSEWVRPSGDANRVQDPAW
jgi:hypothetical protein